MKKKLTFINIFILIFSLVFITTSIAINAETKFPTPTELKYVNDYTNTLSNSTKEYIFSVGKELEAKTSAQATVVLISTLEGRDIESFANELFRTWGIGQKEKDNGLLILVALNDRKWRVEVGRGLEGTITDIYSSRVMEGVARPAFVEGRYDEGIKNSYSIFADSIAKDYNVTLDKNVKVNYLPNSNAKNTINPAFVYIMLGFVFLDIFLNRGRIIRTFFKILLWSSLFGGRRGGGPYGGGGGSGGGFGGGSSSGGGSSGGW